MKKKLNLLWNLKFNFFSVAERPLTFFAYFLNAKKVGRRRLVIVPATAGGLPLFPHAASAFTPALAPVRSHFACGETGLAGRCPRRGQRARYPIFALLKCGPALAPRRLLPFGRISLRETARPVIGPTGADVLACPAFALLKRGPPAKTPALLVFNPVFSAQKSAQPPAFGRRGVDKARKYHFVCVVLSSAPLTLSPLYAPARPVFRNRPKEKAAAENRCGCEHAIYEL